jgi:hypothetical protein
VAGPQVADVAEGHPAFQLVRRVAVHRFQQMPDVVAEREAIERPTRKRGGWMLAWLAKPTRQPAAVPSTCVVTTNIG